MMVRVNPQRTAICIVVLSLHKTSINYINLANHSMIVLETKHILTELIRTLNRDFSQEFGQIVSSLGPEATESIRSLLA